MKTPRPGTLRSYLFVVALAVVATGIGLISAGFGSPPRVALHSHTYRDTGAAIAVADVPPHESSLTEARPAVNLHLYHATQIPAAPTSYTVRSGDTLESIAASQYHNANAWPELWWINRSTILNPNAIRVGQVLKLSGWHPVLPWILREAMKAIPAPPPVLTHGYAQSDSTQSAPVHYDSLSGYGGGTPGGSFGQCVVARESGGQAQVMNASGHYGLYQFAEGTWVAYGGSAADFGHASVAEQERVFANALAQGGQSNWSQYDGC